MNASTLWNTIYGPALQRDHSELSPAALAVLVWMLLIGLALSAAWFVWCWLGFVRVSWWREYCGFSGTGGVKMRRRLRLTFRRVEFAAGFITPGHGRFVEFAREFGTCWPRFIVRVYRVAFGVRFRRFP